jgi:hypothetical protein
MANDPKTCARRLLTRGAILGTVAVGVAFYLFFRDEKHGTDKGEPNRRERGSVNAEHQQDTVSPSVGRTLSPVINNPTHSAREIDRGAAGAQSDIEKYFGAVLTSFDLSPTEIPAVRKILVDRCLAHWDLIDMLNTKDQSDRRVITKSKSAIDEIFNEEIRNLLPPEKTKLVMGMLAVETQLEGVALNVAPKLALLEAPLAGAQRYNLAKASFAFYPPNIPLNRAQITAIDRNSLLSERDTAYIAALEDFLSTQQIQYLKAELLETNRKRILHVDELGK